MHWVPVLNHFDAFFETHVAAREDEDAKKSSPQTGFASASFPAEPTRWIVRASCVILENCANKHVYDSCEHLGLLLSCDDAQVALDALRLLAVATRRAPGSRGNRFRAPASVRSRLLALCSDLPDLAADAARAAAAEEKDAARSRVLEENEEGDEEGGAVRVFGVPSKAARADEKAPPRRAPRRGGKPPAPRGGAAGPPAYPPVSNLGKVQFAFYCPGGEDELLGDLGPAGRRAAVADRATLAASGESDRAAAARLAKAHGVPSGLRFSLFARVRLARLESSADPAEACRATLFRLYAFVVLLQVDRAAAEGDARGGPDESAEAAVAAFLAADQPELVAELFRALRYERAGVPKEVVEACLRALAALAGDRARAASTLAAMRGGGHPAILAALVSSTARRLIEAPRAPVGEALTAANLPKLELDAINADADAPVPIADALVALLSTLVTTHGGCLFLRDVSLLPALLPLLRNRNPRHVHVVSHAVHVLEIFMDYASQAAAAFRDLGGMQIVVQRLKHEAEDALAEHAATHGPQVEPSAAAPSESEGARGASEASAASPPSPSSPPEKPAPTYLVSSTRRVLLKALMRALALTNFSPGTNNVKVAGLEDGSLCAALNLVFRNPRLFGAGVFSLAANLLCDVMNHEPTCYPELEKQEVPQTFLAAWEGPDPGPSPSADALCCLPNALGALCLSPLGLARVKKSGALDALVAAFTSRAYQRAMHGETAGAIGGNIDELLRHVPDLQPAGVRFAIDVLRRLLEVGGMDPGPPDPEPWPDRAPARPAGDAEAAAAPMETDAAARAETSAGAAVAPAATAATAATATTDVPMDPSSVAVSVDMTSHMTRAAPTAPPVSAYFLAEAVANVSRLIDSMLPTDECAETFVRRGGVALLIRLHAMPLLPDSFSTSSACHALSVTLRSFAGRSPYSPILVSQTQDALTQCVRAANDNVERAIRLAAKSDPGQAFVDVADVVAKFREDPSSHGSLDALLHKGVPKDGVADALRDVARVLTVTQSVLNLTTSLLRSSPGTMPGLLNELGDGGEGAAAVKEWKPGGLIDAVSYAHRNVEILGGILAEGAEARDAARQSVAERTRETVNAETSATETDSVAPVVAATASAMRFIDQECVRFRASYNYFCSSLVKNVANARHRASAETVAFLRVPVAELAARLSAVVADVVDGVGGAAVRFRDGSVADAGVLSDGIARRRLCGLFETLHAILIDERRRCSQGLVLNYMDRCLGVERAREAFEALWRVAEHEAGVFRRKSAKARRARKLRRGERESAATTNERRVVVAKTERRSLDDDNEDSPRARRRRASLRNLAAPAAGGRGRPVRLERVRGERRRARRVRPDERREGFGNAELPSPLGPARLRRAPAREPGARGVGGVALEGALFFPGGGGVAPDVRARALGERHGEAPKERRAPPGVQAARARSERRQSVAGRAECG
jgi:E3 ubiquitin-protein ligase HUWE1